jgi:hypothetical protein
MTPRSIDRAERQPTRVLARVETPDRHDLAPAIQRREGVGKLFAHPRIRVHRDGCANGRVGCSGPFRRLGELIGLGLAPATLAKNRATHFSVWSNHTGTLNDCRESIQGRNQG